MPAQPETEHNIATYRRLRDTINRTYAYGWFVGIADDGIVGAASDFRALERALQEQGKDPRHVLVVEAGVDYPEQATILRQ